MYVLLLAAAWGAGTGLLIPRAAYRLSVQPDEPWHAACPAGHPITGPFGGWLGLARCTHGPAGERDAHGAGEGVVPDTPGVGAVPSGADATPPGGADGPVPAAADETAPGSPGATMPEPSDGAASAVADGTTPAVAEGTASPVADDTASRPAGSSADRRHPRYGPRPGPVAAVAALFCLALAAATGARPELVVWLLAVPVAVLLALVDRAVHRLPDVLTLPLTAGVAALLGAAALLPEHRGSWPGALLGGLVLGAGYFLLCVIYPQGMGLGDAKLALALGAVLGWYGWTVLFIGFLAGLVLGSCYGAGLMVLRRADRKTGIPLGPFMLGGAFLGVLVGTL